MFDAQRKSVTNPRWMVMFGGMKQNCELLYIQLLVSFPGKGFEEGSKFRRRNHAKCLKFRAICVAKEPD